MKKYMINLKVFNTKQSILIDIQYHTKKLIPILIYWNTYIKDSTKLDINTVSKI